MFTLLWNLSVALRAYLRLYMPTNRAVDWLRSPHGLKWAIPVALIATPSYLLAMSVCATVVERGGSEHLNLWALLFAWNAIKFAILGVFTPVRWFTWGKTPHSFITRSSVPFREAAPTSQRIGDPGEVFCVQGGPLPASRQSCARDRALGEPARRQSSAPAVSGLAVRAAKRPDEGVHL